MKRHEPLYVAQSAMIAALYVSLTIISNMLGLWEIRFSEALCILPYFTAAAVPGLTIGCVLSNLMTGCAAWDVVFGSFATFAGAYIARKLSKKSWIFAPWPNIISNTLIVPLILRYVYFDTSRTLTGLFVYMAASEIVSAGVLGYILLHALKKHERIFQL